jgi:hypothetical protein
VIRPFRTASPSALRTIWCTLSTVFGASGPPSLAPAASSTPAFTMTVYQRVLPGMQRDAAELFARLVSSDEVAMVPVAER